MLGTVGSGYISQGIFSTKIPRSFFPLSYWQIFLLIEALSWCFKICEKWFFVTFLAFLFFCRRFLYSKATKARFLVRRPALEVPTTLTCEICCHERKSCKTLNVHLHFAHVVSCFLNKLATNIHFMVIRAAHQR